ncbi:hypothetical protein AAF712_015430 [Marasmius tenuissimus]|uniref:F-box domain-containing protein n=1 Tax=Marasmius tenuissimus TaxID=585030 RepID=A0ABR2Z9C1_9AGAR
MPQNERHDDCVDNFQHLPVEVTRRIMGSGVEESSFRVDALMGKISWKMADVFQWCQVSSTLRNIGLSDKTLWRKINLTGPRFELTSDALGRIGSFRYLAFFALFAEILERAGETPLDVTLTIDTYFGRREDPTHPLSRLPPFTNRFFSTLSRTGNWRSLSLTSKLPSKQTITAMKRFETNISTAAALAVYKPNTDTSYQDVLSYLAISMPQLVSCTLWTGCSNWGQDESEVELTEPWDDLYLEGVFQGISHWLSNANLPGSITNLTDVTLAGSDENALKILAVCPRLASLRMLLLDCDDSLSNSPEDLKQSILRCATVQQTHVHLHTLTLVMTSPQPWLANVFSRVSCPALLSLAFSYPRWPADDEDVQLSR